MEKKKLTYEELEAAANGLHEQNKALSAQYNQLVGKVREMQEFAAFKRLDYLFKVVEMGDTKFPVEFVTTCTEEIVASMTIPEVDNTEVKEEN